MKKSVILLVFLTFSSYVFSQVIKGTVSDVRDKKPVQFAYVYIGGTMVGTNTDSDGFFKLDISKYPGIPVTISAIGYYQFTLKDYPKSEPVQVFMTPRVIELNEVVISDKSLERIRKSNLKLFRTAFLGNTVNGSLSVILNEDDIHFIYDDSDTLKAYSTEPLKIKNMGLGYIVTYFLEEFEYDRRSDSFYFLGNILFDEDMGNDESVRQKFDRRREASYKGSRMHLLRELWNNHLDLTGFQLEDSKGNRITYEEIVEDDGGTNKYLWYPEKLTVFYQLSEPAGEIYFKDDPVYFDKSGYFDPFNLIWGGNISNQRIGDWLPYEYSLPK